MLACALGHFNSVSKQDMLQNETCFYSRQNPVNFGNSTAELPLMSPSKPFTSYILGFVWKNYLCIEVIRALESVHKKGEGHSIYIRTVSS